ncbi:MAG TPA: hypothetical protein VFV70_10125 [Hyphomonadaceae bacterium]|nr:hypothetical protein [Hyphomonadaceae bacterium]
MMGETPKRYSAACAVVGVCVLLLGFGAAPVVAQPAGVRNDVLESREIVPGKVKPRYGEAAGTPCTGGSGVTVCPTLKAAADPNTIRDVVGAVKGKQLKLRLCVSAQGVPEDVEIAESTGKAKADREMVKFIGTYRYNPGTVDGAPARLCDVLAEFRF